MAEQKKNPFNLATIGGICILAGMVAGLVGPSPTDAAGAFGRGVAQLLFVIVGIGLIIAYFVRSGSPKERHDSRGPRRLSGAQKRHERRKHRHGGE